MIVVKDQWNNEITMRIIIREWEKFHFIDLVNNEFNEFKSRKVFFPKSQFLFEAVNNEEKVIQYVIKRNWMNQNNRFSRIIWI